MPFLEKEGNEWSCAVLRVSRPASAGMYEGVVLRDFKFRTRVFYSPSTMTDYDTYRGYFVTLER